MLGILGLLWIAAMTVFDYQSAFEPFAAYPEILNPLIEDRKSILLNDLMRSLGFVVALYIICRFALIEKLKRYVIIVVALVIHTDLWSFSRNYINNDDFANKSVMQRPFQATAADRAATTERRPMGSSHCRSMERRPRLGLGAAGRQHGERWAAGVE